MLEESASFVICSWTLATSPPLASKPMAIGQLSRRRVESEKASHHRETALTIDTRSGLSLRMSFQYIPECLLESGYQLTLQNDTIRLSSPSAFALERAD